MGSIADALHGRDCQMEKRRADMDRLYVPRKERGRGLAVADIQDSVNMEEQSKKTHARILFRTEEELLKTTKEEITMINWNDVQHKHRLRQDHKDKWMTRALHGQFLRQTREVVDLESCRRNVTYIFNHFYAVCAQSYLIR